MLGRFDFEAGSPASKLCHCGKPLHYQNLGIERMVLKLIDKLGEFTRVTVRGHTWLVPRHYLALHGLNESKIESLGFTEASARPSGASFLEVRIAA